MKNLDPRKIGPSALIAIVGHFFAYAISGIGAILVYWIILIAFVIGANIIFEHVRGKGIFE